MSSVRKPKILFVDDDEGIRVIMSVRLEEALSCDVACAICGDDAVKVIQEQAFDFIISDFCMNQGSGLDFLRAARDQGIETPFIFFTSLPEQDFEEHIGAPLLRVFHKTEFPAMVSFIAQHLTALMDQKDPRTAAK